MKGNNMIRPVSSYNPAFTSKTVLAKRAAGKATEKVTRQVVNLEKSNLKGISKTPIRLAEKVDPDTQAALTGFGCSAVGLSIFGSSIM